MKNNNNNNNNIIVAILPAYNLENSIGDIISRTKEFVDYIIVVADGSNDRTHEIAIKNGAIVPEFTSQRGKGFAVIKGINESKQYYPDIIILMDADGQHLPEEIPVLIKAILTENIDMVVGSRMLGNLETSLINKFGNFCLKLISFSVSGKWMTDTESGFRVFKANKLYELELKSNGYEVESELFLKALHKKHSIKEIPITVPFAVPGVTVFDGIKMGIYKLIIGFKLKFGLLD